MNTASLLIHPEELSDTWIDRIASEGIPTVALHPKGGGKAHLYVEELVQLLKTSEYRDLIDRAAQAGLKIEYEMHAMGYLLPREAFTEHPEWFRENETGERTPHMNCCASNEEALDYIAKRAAELAKKLYKSTDRYFFWLDDVKGCKCHCAKCASLSASDQQLTVLNAIIKRLRQDNPKATLAYLAYHDTLEVPNTVKAEKGIFLEYAPITRDPHKPISECGESNPISALLNFFGTEGSKVLEYWYDNSLYSKWKKPPVRFEADERVLHADVEYYTSLGFEDISSFACFLGADYEELYGKPDVSAFGKEIRNKL